MRWLENSKVFKVLTLNVKGVNKEEGESEDGYSGIKKNEAKRVVFGKYKGIYAGVDERLRGLERELQLL